VTSAIPWWISYPATGAPSPALASRMLAETRERGLLIGKGGLYGHTLRMAPPMNVSEADAKEGLGILADALLQAPGFTLRGGTTEILRGIVAKAVAGV